MRTVIDLTEDDSPAGGPCMPSPCSVYEEEDDVVVALRETELRMTIGQFFEYQEAINRFAFREGRDANPRVDLDEEEDYYPAAEHEVLCKLVVALLGDAFDGVEVPAALRDRIRWSLAKSTKHDRWRDQELRIGDLQARVKELTEEPDEARTGMRRVSRRRKPGDEP